jgi:hypothetical protein
MLRITPLTSSAGVVQNRPVSGDTDARERRPTRAGFRLEGCPEREAASRPGSGSLGLKRSQAEQAQPVRMRLAGQQLARALTPALGMPAAQEAAVVQKEAQQLQVAAAEMAAQGEVLRSREFRFSTSELRRGVSAMVWLTAATRAWNLPPSCARSRFHPCQ